MAAFNRHHPEDAFTTTDSYAFKYMLKYRGVSSSDRSHKYVNLHMIMASHSTGDVKNM